MARRLSMLACALAALALLLVLVPRATPVQAVAFVVTTAADNAIGSLREVITNSNAAAPGPNQITFNIAPGG
ncbi:MAG TPA: hypothetical protein VK132_02550, partial [Gemmatimonadales bacterium]|nr:hypothetical protein [Gemmatimonadales bacterium]